MDDAEPIPLFEIDYDESDISNVTESITRGGYWAKGPYVDEFEERLEALLGVEHAVTVNSGTTALVATLEALGIDGDDEVIVPSFTFIATANSVRLTGGEPVFADIEPETYGLDPKSVEAQITDSTAAIIPVHCYGAGCRIQELVEVAAKHDIPLVEDAAEVLGAEYNSEKLGTFGDAAALSFCQNKILPTGEGGAVVTDDDNLAEAVELYRSHGRASSEYFQSAGSGQYAGLGTNIRMSDLTAALGCSQLDRIDNLIAGRREAAERLDRGFEKIDGVSPHQPSEGGTHVYQLYTVELSEEINRQHVVETLDEHGVSSKVYWDPPAHRAEYYQRTKTNTPTLAVTDKIAGQVLSLPMHPNLTAEETDRIVAAVEAAVE